MAITHWLHQQKWWNFLAVSSAAAHIISSRADSEGGRVGEVQEEEEERLRPPSLANGSLSQSASLRVRPCQRSLLLRKYGQGSSKMEVSTFCSASQSANNSHHHKGNQIKKPHAAAQALR